LLLLLTGVNSADDTRANHDVIAGLHCWKYCTKFFLYSQNGHMAIIAHITQLGPENTFICLMLIN